MQHTLTLALDSREASVEDLHPVVPQHANAPKCSDCKDAITDRYYMGVRGHSGVAVSLQLDAFDTARSGICSIRSVCVSRLRATISVRVRFCALVRVCAAMSVRASVLRLLSHLTCSVCRCRNRSCHLWVQVGAATGSETRTPLTNVSLTLTGPATADPIPHSLSDMLRVPDTLGGAPYCLHEAGGTVLSSVLARAVRPAQPRWLGSSAAGHL